MSKVKIVHIVYMGEDGAQEYLDDKGRVWYRYRTRDNGTLPSEWRWKQLELPEEPDHA